MFNCPKARPIRRALIRLPALVFVLAAPQVQAQIRLAFVVNEDHYAITEEDLARTAAYAQDSLRAATGKTYTYQGAVWGHFGAADPHVIFREYLLAHLKSPADYVVIFTKHPQALQSGGFTLNAFGTTVDDLRQELQSMPGYCNPVGSPYRPPGSVYGAVIDWEALLGQCGYELQGMTWVHVSPTSFDGQCRNTPGLTCIFEYGEWQCPNFLTDPEWAPLLSDRRRFTAQSINHELLHNFGWRGIDDHECPPGTARFITAQSTFNMCGSTVIALKLAGRRCVLDKRPVGTVCTRGAQCLNSYCYEFGPAIEYQCSHACKSAAGCESVPGKEAFCRRRRLDIAATDLSCFYQAKP